MFCSKCGTKALEGATFCQKCGARLPAGDIGQQMGILAANEAIHFQPDDPATNNKSVEDLLDVTLINAGVNKVCVIKTVRELTGLGLKEAKELVESAPVLLKKEITHTEATMIKKTLINVGAIVTFANQEGNCVDVIIHCKACGVALEDGSNICKSCGRVFTSLPKQDSSATEVDVKAILDSNIWTEAFEDFKKMPISRKIITVTVALLTVGLVVLLLRFIFSAPVLIIVVAAGGYFVYYRWGAKYITEHRYHKKIKELHLPNGMTSQILLEALSDKFNYPYFKGVRYGENGECVIDGKYSAYAVTLFDNDTATLSANLNVQENMKRAVMLEGMAICSYLNKFFNPSLPADVVKDVKILKSTERQRKTVGVVITVASILIVAVVASEYVLPGSLQRMAKPGAEVRGAYLTEYSETVTVEEAFNNFFANEKWSTYKSEGYSYVVVTGSCKFMGEQADARLTFKITGEQFRVDSLDVNGQEQGDLVMYSLLSKVYEDYEEE